MALDHGLEVFCDEQVDGQTRINVPIFHSSRGGQKHQKLFKVHPDNAKIKIGTVVKLLLWPFYLPTMVKTN